MKKGILMILISLLTIVASYASDVDVTISVPEDYGIDFPAGLNLDRLYIAMENEKGDIEILTESDIDVGVAYDAIGSVDLCLLYYGNLSQPYAVQLTVDAADGFILKDEKFGTFTIPISPVITMPQLTSFSTADVVLSAEDNQADLIVYPSGPIRGERVADITLNWNGGRDLLPGFYMADISMSLISE